MAELAEFLTPQSDEDRLVAAEAAARSYCGWHIAPSRTDTVRVYASPSNAPILLPSLYVTAIVSVTDQGTLLDPTAYDFETCGILRRIDGRCWATGTGVVQVVFTHGYTTAPADVTEAIQALAAVSGQGGVRQRTAGPFSESYVGDLSPLSHGALSRYRIPVGP